MTEASGQGSEISKSGILNKVSHTLRRVFSPSQSTPESPVSAAPQNTEPTIKWPVVTKRDLLLKYLPVGVAALVAGKGYYDAYRRWFKPAEAPKTDETSGDIRPPDQILSRDYGEGEKSIHLSITRFDPKKTEEVEVVDKSLPKRLVVFMPGWPIDASLKPAWSFPGQLSDAFGTTCLAISAYSQREDPEGMVRQAEGIYRFLLEQVSPNNNTSELPKEADLIKILKSMEIVVAGHSGGTKKEAYLSKFLQDKGIEPAAVVLMSPMGLKDRGLPGLIYDFYNDAKKIGPRERQRTGVRAGDKNPVVEKIPAKELGDSFWGSLSMIRKRVGIAGMWSEFRSFGEKDPIYSQIKAPVIVLSNDQDMISNHRSYFPEARLQAQVLPLTPDQQIELSGKLYDARRERIKRRENWDSLTEPERNLREQEFIKKLGTRDQFIQNDRPNLAKRVRLDEMVRLRKAREVIAREIFKQSKGVQVLIPTRQADHTGVIASRARQVRPLVDRVKRVA